MSRSKGRASGQGLVEFALTLPLLILVLLISVDGGRLFYGYISLQNATRIAANYAALHPDDWPDPPAGTNPLAYDDQITRDTANLSCDPNVFSPTFTEVDHAGESVPLAKPRGAGSGHVATVSLTCVFHPMTPIIGSIIGDAVTLTATDVFPIRAGILAEVPIYPALPPPPPPTPGPGECTVPTLIGSTKTPAVAAWSAAGFNLNKFNWTLSSDNDTIASEWQVQGQTFTYDTWDGKFEDCNTFKLNVGP